MASLKNYFAEEPTGPVPFDPEDVLAPETPDYTKVSDEDLENLVLRKGGIHPDPRAEREFERRGALLPDSAERYRLPRPAVSATAAPESSNIPVRIAPPNKDVGATTGVIAPTTPASPAGPANADGRPGLPAPTSSVSPLVQGKTPPVIDTVVKTPDTGGAVPGAGGDSYERDLYLARLAAQSAAGFGSMGAGKNIDMGIADTLGERLKQVQALRAKREEQALVDAQAQANNRAQVEYLMKRFPERREALAGLRDMTKSPNFAQMLRVEEQIALDQARKADLGARAEERGRAAQYRAGVLGLRRDTLEENRRYHDIQAGLRQSEIDLRRAESERKAAGATEPSEKERSTFQTMMKPAEKTAVALRDADMLNTLGNGMLLTGKPPEFLSRADIAAFNGIPFGEASRSLLAESNPQAFDLLTKMAELKTVIGHEYFGSALSPSEAERQRQFLDFGATDSPESIARKMKSYHDTLADKARVFLRPRIVGRPLGDEWAQMSGLDALSAPGGTFEGLLAVPKGVTAKAATTVPPPTSGMTRMTAPNGQIYDVPNDKVSAAKAKGWKE